MVESTDRPKRPGGPPKGKRPDSARPSKGTPSAGRSFSPRSGGDGRPQRNGDKPAWQKRDGQNEDRPKRDGQPRDGQPRTRREGDGGKREWPKRESQPRDAQRPAASGGPRSDGPRGGGARGDGLRGGGARGGGPKRDSQPRGGSGRREDPRLWTRDGSPARGDASSSSRELPEDRDPYGTKSVRARHDAPEIPEDVLPNQLDRIARTQLKTLSKENADEVARHMVMAARLIDEDPELAHLHAVSAGRRAGRIAVVRETLAITAYSIGDFALALRELRTYRRISGLDDQLPMMVDCERGLGRPERALELGRSVPRASLTTEVQVELAIAMSGARLDLEQIDAALVELQIPQLDPNIAFPWSPALFDAYAAVLEDLGREEEAEIWFKSSDAATAALADGDDDDDFEIEVFEEDVAEEDVAEEDVAEEDVAEEDVAEGEADDGELDVVIPEHPQSVGVNPERVELGDAGSSDVDDIVAAPRSAAEFVGQVPVELEEPTNPIEVPDE